MHPVPKLAGRPCGDGAGARAITKDELGGWTILVAEDDAGTRALLEGTLKSWGFRVIVAADGDQAWQAIESEDPPFLLILDWIMPGMDGLEVCRRLRSIYPDRPTYVILLTAKEGRDDLIQGLHSGANDYIAKPFDYAELRARVGVGSRVIRLQKILTDRVKELQQALSKVKQLQGLLPICAYCKKVRDDKNYWQQVEAYISKHSDVHFSHGICPDCYQKIVESSVRTESCKIEGHR